MAQDAPSPRNTPSSADAPGSPARRRIPAWQWAVGGASLVGIAACVACLATILPWAGVGIPAVPPGSLKGRIVYVSEINGELFIYRMNADGTQPTRLSEKPGDYAPAWSPDGSKIAFVIAGANQDYNYDVHIMNIDGSQRSPALASGSLPDWSPDGRKIAFSSIAGDIRVMDADGGRLTPLFTQSSTASSPAWSPDGRKIAFQMQVDGRNEIFVMPADGGNPTRLTSGGGNDPAWSPDGRKIAYDWDGIYSMNADGSERVLLKGGIFHSDPTWSPDGLQIAFAAGFLDNPRICVIDIDGSNLRCIDTGLPGSEGSPDWAP